MTVWSTDKQGNKITYDWKQRLWKNDEETMSIGGKKHKVCPKCHKPTLDLNGVKDCDWCLQSLTVCDFIDFACCGHGDPKYAYISFKDGRRWVLDQSQKNSKG